MNKRAVGGYGEALARKHLEKQGYAIHAQNVYTSHGEIDLIASKGGPIVFVEVKYRTSSAFGRPEESVTPQKLDHFRKAIAAWCDQNGWPKKWRADVIAITDERETPLFEVFEDILT